MAINNPIVGNATSVDTVYTMVPSNANLLPVLLTQGITGPIILQQFGEQRKFNFTQRAKSGAFGRTTDGNVLVYNTPVSDWVGVEISFVPTSPTVQTLSNLAIVQRQLGGPIVFSLNATNASRITTVQYPFFILLTPFSGFEENERAEDVVFEFAAITPSMVNVGALANAVGNLI
jgi:hypothetical protein